MAVPIFTLHNDGDEFVIVRDSDARQALRLRNLPELLQLRARLNRYIETQQDDGSLSEMFPETTWIDTATARELAQAQGKTLSHPTIISACERGSIEGARKDGGRWVMPRGSFERWYEGWNQRRRS